MQLHVLINVFNQPEFTQGAQFSTSTFILKHADKDSLPIKVVDQRPLERHSFLTFILSTVARSIRAHSLTFVGLKPTYVIVWISQVFRPPGP
jgi:hypothetical protein